MRVNVSRRGATSGGKRLSAHRPCNGPPAAICGRAWPMRTHAHPLTRKAGVRCANTQGRGLAGGGRGVGRGRLDRPAVWRPKRLVPAQLALAAARRGGRAARAGKALSRRGRKAGRAHAAPFPSLWEPSCTPGATPVPFHNTQRTFQHRPQASRTTLIHRSSGPEVRACVGSSGRRRHSSQAQRCLGGRPPRGSRVRMSQRSSGAL
jgi:hypothetical protein